MKPIGRHRLVNSCLEEELKTGVHALSIQVERPFGDHLNPIRVNSEDPEQKKNFSNNFFSMISFCQASSPQQWSGVVNKSPACKGGFGK